MFVLQDGNHVIRGDDFTFYATMGTLFCVYISIEFDVSILWILGIKTEI